MKTQSWMRLCACIVLLAGIGARTAMAGGQNHLPRPMANFSLSREFYLTFPENLHEGSGPLDLTCFIASNYKTKGTMELLGPGKSVVWKQNFVIDSQGVAQIMVPHGFNNSAEIQALENEKQIRKAIHIVADQPIVVYGLDHWPYTTDGYLAIPPAAWGTSYRVASYYGITRTDEYPTIRATSQFAVVSAYDNTVVNILLTDATMNGNGVKTHNANTQVSFILNKGEVYQMQALKVNNQLNDLSGTIVQSSKPVGVFSGVKCTDIPKTKPACDNLLEMLPPTDTWGLEYFTFPFDLTRTGGDTWRVFPLEDGTEVKINGNVITTISPSDPVNPFYETDNLTRPELRNAGHWEFSKPVLVCQYINGQTYDNSDHGDPSFVVLETREQFETGVVFATPPDSNGFTNYINVMICDTFGAASGLKDSLYLDGRPVGNLPSGNYLLEKVQQIPGTTFYALHIKIPGGVHRLRGKSVFSAYAVGFKNFESYAWACALALKQLGSRDTVHPVPPTQLVCGEVSGMLIDYPDDSTRSNLAQIGDNNAGIGWLYFTGRDSTYNFDSVVFSDPNNFTPGDSQAPVHIKVTNLRQNAHGALYVVDRAGNDTVYYYDYIADTVTVAPGVRIFGQVFAGTSKTDSIIIQNPLNRNVQIDSIWLVKNATFTIVSGATPVPFTLRPNEKRTLVVKYSPPVDGFYEDTVMIKFDCFQRPLARVIGGSGTPCVQTSDIDYGTRSLSGGSVVVDSILFVSNNGTDPLVITGMQIAGGAASPFQFQPTPPQLPVTIAVGETPLTVKIRFTSAVTGTFRDSLIVTSNTRCSSADSIGLLMARVVQPGPQLATDSTTNRVACGIVVPDGMTVSNVGSIADELLTIDMPGGNTKDFSFNGPRFNLPLSPQQSVRVPVTFTPSDTGRRSAIVRASFQSGAVLFDTLHGYGIHPIMTSSDVDFGQQIVGFSNDSFAVATRIKKVYNDNLGMRRDSIFGPDAAAFTFIDKNVPIALPNAGNDTMHVQIRFSPTHAGPHTATLRYIHDGSFGLCQVDTTYDIALSGIGVVQGISLTTWNDTVFLTQPREAVISAFNNNTATTLTVDSVWLVNNAQFKIDMSAGHTVVPFSMAGQTSAPVYLTFTPTDTVTYFDTLYVRDKASGAVSRTPVQATGKVVVYTITVPLGIHGAFGTEAPVPISLINNGYTRPSSIDPGASTPIDSGKITALTLGLQYDRHVIRPMATDNSTVTVAGAITSGYTVAVQQAGNGDVVFDLTGGPQLTTTGLLANIRMRALYSPTLSSNLIDSAGSPQPWVLWKAVPGLFILDSICGLGSNLRIFFGGVALDQSAPNPVSAVGGTHDVTIPFSIDRDMHVSLIVYNGVGAEVATLVNAELRKGTYVIPFPVAGVPGGMYYYRLAADGALLTRTMVVVH